jgi:hypothetical protein
MRHLHREEDGVNRQILYTGIGLLVAGGLLNAIVGATTRSYENDPLDGIGGLMMFVGLILIIVGAVKGTGGGQQQQQQVVVYAGAPGDAAPATPRLDLRCATCRTLNERNARFCMECGKPIPQPRAASAAAPAKARPAASRRK